MQKKNKTKNPTNIYNSKTEKKKEIVILLLTLTVWTALTAATGAPTCRSRGSVRPAKGDHSARPVACREPPAEAQTAACSEDKNNKCPQIAPVRENGIMDIIINGCE